MGPADDAVREETARRNTAWATRVRDEGVAAFMDWWAELPLFASQRSLPADVRARLREGRLANAPEDLALQFEEWGQHHQASKPKSLAFLASASQDIPVAYLAGDLDRKYRAVAREVEASCPSARVAILPDAGHNIHLEAPQAFVRALIEALG